MSHRILKTALTALALVLSPATATMAFAQAQTSAEAAEAAQVASIVTQIQGILNQYTSGLLTIDSAQAQITALVRGKSSDFLERVLRASYKIPGVTEGTRLRGLVNTAITSAGLLQDDSWDSIVGVPFPNPPQTKAGGSSGAAAEYVPPVPPAMLWRPVV